MNAVEQYQQFARTAKRLHTMGIVYRNWSKREWDTTRSVRYSENAARLARDAKDLLMRARWFKDGCIERGEIHG